MFINNNIFNISKKTSDLSNYKYCYKSFFYKFYSKINKEGIEEFYTAEENYSSILERIKFYKNYIIYDDYPIFNKNGVLSIVSGNSPLVLQQVLSLPDGCIFLDKTKKEMYPIDEIISKIHFEKSLNNYPYLSNKSNDIEVNRIFNYFVSQGFYFLNIEDLLKENEKNDIPIYNYPFYIDENKFLLKYEKLNAEQLFITFFENFFILPKDYIKYFTPINNMSIQEQIKYAFNDKKDDNDIEIQIKNAIKRYYYCILKNVLRNINNNDIFIEFSIDKNALDHYNSNFFLKYNLIAYGNKISMIGETKQLFEKNNDIVTYKNTKNNKYYLQSKDIKQVEFNFNVVKKYLSNHLEFKFMPQIFIKMIGLPYEIFDYVKWFDFASGSCIEFISLLPIINNETYYDLEIISLIGDVLSSDDEENIFSYYIKSICKNEIYFLTYDKELFFTNNIIVSKYKRNDLSFVLEKSSENKIMLDDLVSENIEIFNKEMDNIKIKFNDFSNSSFINIEELKGEYQIALETRNVTNIINDFFTFSSDLFIDELIDEYYDYFIRIKKRINNNSIISDLNYLDIVYDQFLVYPYIHIGRMFFAYSLYKDDEIYFDSSQKDVLKKYFNLINYYYLNNIKYPFYISENQYIEVDIKKYLELIIGLPKKCQKNIVLSDDNNKLIDIEKTLDNLNFKDNLAIELYHPQAILNNKKMTYSLISNYIISKFNVIPQFLNNIKNKYNLIYIDEKDNNLIKYKLNLYKNELINNKFDTLIYNKKLNNKLIKNNTSEITNLFNYSIHKTFMYYAYEKLFFIDNYYFKDKDIYYNNEKYNVEYGYIFNTFIKDNKCYFNKEDLDLIYKSYLLNYKNINENNCLDIIINIGLSITPTTKLIEAINKKDYKLLSIEDIKKMFNFVDNIYLNKYVYEYKNMFMVDRISYNLYSLNYNLKHKLLSNGLLVLPGSINNINKVEYNNEIYDFKDYFNELNKKINFIIDEKISGDLYSFLYPNKSLFYLLLENFTKDISYELDYDINECIRIKNHIEKTFNNHNDLIYNLAKYLSRDINLAKKYLNEINYYEDTNLDYPYKISNSEKENYLFIFFYYILKQIIFCINSDIK